MRIFAISPPVATISAVATFTLADWQRSLAEFALYAVSTGVLVALVVIVVALAEPVTRPARAEWHRRRADDLRDRGAMVSGVLPLAWAAFVVLAMAEWAHSLRAEGLGL